MPKRLIRLLKNLFSRQKVEQDLDDELRQFIDQNPTWFISDAMPFISSVRIRVAISD